MALVLVVDDEQMLRDLLCDRLSRAGHQTVTAGDGQAGLDLCKTMDIHLAITDIGMPRMDGIVFIRTLRQRHPQTRILAICALGEPLLDHAIDAGADRTLSKPFDPSLLMNLVEELLSQSLQS